MFIEPVARFRSPFKTKFGIPRQAGLVPELKGRIVFEPRFRSVDAVRGLEGFEYIWLIWGFSGNRPRSVAESVAEPSHLAAEPVEAVAEPVEAAEPMPCALQQVQRPQRPGTAFRATVRPPRLGGNERVGVFASRSPFRPNGLGLSSVRIESIEYDARDADGKPLGPVINVLGADLMDGTPVYDIKPYVTYADSHPQAASGFVDENDWKPLKVVFAPSVTSASSVTEAGSVTGTGSVPAASSVAEPVEATWSERVSGASSAAEPVEATWLERVSGESSVAEPVEATGLERVSGESSAAEPVEATVPGWTEADMASLKEVLAQDPRPQYRNDPDKEYGMTFNDMDIRFKVNGDVLTVTGLKPV